MPLRDDLLNPIPGDNPSGVSLRYDPVTDKIKEARREEIDVPQGAWQYTLKVADFPQVIKLASDAIATKSKDLQLAVWLVEAHVRREGFVVVTPSLVFLRDLLEKFWDTLYPEIEEGDLEVRAAPLDWLGSKFEPQLRWLPVTSSKLSWFKYKESRTVGSEAEAAASDDRKKLRAQLIKDGKISAEEFDQAVDETPKAFYETLQAQLTDSLAALTALSEFCDEKFGDQAPSFIRFRTALEDLSQLARMVINKKGGPTPGAPPPPEPVAVAEQPAPAAAYTPAVQQAPRAAAQPAAPMQAAGYDPTDLEDAARRLGAIARYLRKQDVYHIGPYLILRGLRWGEIRYNGPQIDAQMLEPPPAELRARVKKAAIEENWDEVLEATEAAMELPCGRGWLDIQRYAVQALDNKGQWFAFVAGAIRSALRALLQDLPGLLDMSLLDDTPVANAETRAWIQEQVLPESAAGPPMLPVAQPVYAPPPAPMQVNLAEPPPTVSDDGAAPGEPDPFDAALEFACSGRQAEAIDTLFRALASEQTNRGRFKRKVQLAHILIASGRDDVAYPILDEVASEIEQRRLEDWEAGKVIAYPLTLLLQCLKSLNADPDAARQVYARICRLDPVKALDCAP
jgi:type VI secretion system protein ImpA